MSARLDSLKSQYYEGEKITGKVCLISESQSLEGVQVWLKGAEHTSWKVRELWQDHPVHYMDHNTFLKLEARLLEGERLKSGEGEYECPFEVQLPKHLPGSYSVNSGWIRYTIEVTDKSGSSFTNNKMEVKIISHINLNEIEGLKLTPVSISETETSSLGCSWFCSSGFISADIDLPKQAFVVDEVVPVEVKIKNKGYLEIVSVHAKIWMTVQSIVRGPYRQSKSKSALLTADSIYGIIHVNQDASNRFHLKIPTSVIVPNFALCKLFSQTFTLEVTCQINDFADVIRAATNIVIGHIPLDEHQASSHQSRESTWPRSRLPAEVLDELSATPLNKPKYTDPIDYKPISYSPSRKKPATSRDVETLDEMEPMIALSAGKPTPYPPTRTDRPYPPEDPKSPDLYLPRMHGAPYPPENQYSASGNSALYPPEPKPPNSHLPHSQPMPYPPFDDQHKPTPYPAETPYRDSGNSAPYPPEPKPPNSHLPHSQPMPYPPCNEQHKPAPYPAETPYRDSGNSAPYPPEPKPPNSHPPHSQPMPYPPYNDQHKPAPYTAETPYRDSGNSAPYPPEPKPPNSHLPHSQPMPYPPYNDQHKPAPYTAETPYRDSGNSAPYPPEPKPPNSHLPHSQPMPYPPYNDQHKPAPYPAETPYRDSGNSARYPPEPKPPNSHLPHSQPMPYPLYNDQHKPAPYPTETTHRDSGNSAPYPPEPKPPKSNINHSQKTPYPSFNDQVNVTPYPPVISSPDIGKSGPSPPVLSKPKHSHPSDIIPSQTQKSVLLAVSKPTPYRSFSSSSSSSKNSPVLNSPYPCVMPQPERPKPPYPTSGACPLAMPMPKPDYLHQRDTAPYPRVTSQPPYSSGFKPSYLSGSQQTPYPLDEPKHPHPIGNKPKPPYPIDDEASPYPNRPSAQGMPPKCDSIGFAVPTSTAKSLYEAVPLVPMPLPTNAHAPSAPTIDDDDDLAETLPSTSLLEGSEEITPPPKYEDVISLPSVATPLKKK